MAAWVMAVVFAVSGAQTAFAATSYVNSVSITLDVTPTVGESLPDLDVGYNSDNCEVSIPNNDKYDIVSAKWSSTKNDVKIGGTYTMKVTLKTLNDYRFSSSSYTSSKVKVNVGIGALAIFGSYIGKERRLTGEAISITVLDTIVALVAGLIIFPSCFAFDVNPGQGPGLVFVTLPNVFREMAGGRIWGALFFLFMSFAAFSTIIAVFQNIIQFARDMWGISLKKSVLINGVLLILLAVPCVLGMTDWAGFSIGGKSIMDIEDFLVSNNLLPIGSLVYLLFCMTRYGWGWDNFIKEANTGSGVKFPTHKAIRFYLTFILPLIVLFIFVQGYWGLIAG